MRFDTAMITSRRSAILAGTASVTIALSFAFQWFLLTRLGATRQLDAYFAALAVPIVVLYVLCEPILRVAVPALAVRTGQEFFAFAWSTFRAVGFLFLAAALLLGGTAWLWVPLLTPGFARDDHRLVISLVHVLLVGMILQAASGVGRSAWQAKHSFIYPAVVGATSAALAFAFLAATFHRFGVVAAAWAFNVRFAVEFVALLPALGAYVPRKSAEAATRKKLLKDARPLLLGAAYARTDVLVDRVLSSMAPPGNLSLLYLAQQILAAIGQVINQTLVAPTGPPLAQLAHRFAWGEFRVLLRRQTVRIGILVVALAVVVPLAGRPLLQLIFGHRNVGPEQIQQLLILLLALTGLLIGDALGYLANSSFYSLGDTRTPALATGIVYSILIPIKIGAFVRFGIIGLAVTTSAYYLVNLVVLTLLLHAKLTRLANGTTPPPGPPVNPVTPLQPQMKVSS